MTRSELEHLIRAAGAIADDAEIVVIGSQSVLGQFPAAPTALLVKVPDMLLAGQSLVWSLAKAAGRPELRFPAEDDVDEAGGLDAAGL
jgi:hypothetical protein